MLNIHDPASLEKYSSAVTLSDMEVFIFPDLMFPLVLANMMSPLVWSWKDDRWFRKLDSMSDYKKIQRIKQYIMDHFDFNLDLETWGLTRKENELARFSSFIDEDTLAQSNALFGYEGDQYYFDIDIRRHFGLEKYDDNVIPYWKTETVDAMQAFQLKEGHSKGAGECVSLSTLYYAALWILGKVPADQIWMVATPLHSQNFVDIQEGMLTNNRRLVTKNMWFNGTALSQKAKRALVNERITFISNIKGYVHRIYPEATLAKEDYEHFSKRLHEYLTTQIDYSIICNFLREYQKRQTCFQFEHNIFGKTMYIPAETVYRYEHSSPFQVGSETEKKLLDSIEEDEFYHNPLKGRVSLKAIEHFFGDNSMTLEEMETDPEGITKQLETICERAKEILPDLLDFCRTVPKLPQIKDRAFTGQGTGLDLSGITNRSDLIRYIKDIQEEQETAALAMLAYRDIHGENWYPFMKAALERNPVTLEWLKEASLESAHQRLSELPNESIYSEHRLAQPDEVINFKTGDGLEKLLCLWNHAKNNLGIRQITLEMTENQVILSSPIGKFSFASTKSVTFPKSFHETLKELGIA